MTIGSLYRPGKLLADDPLADALDVNNGLPAGLDAATLDADIGIRPPLPAATGLPGGTVTPSGPSATGPVGALLVGTGNFKIELEFDANAQAAGAAFEASIAQAATLLTQAIHSQNDVTINISVGADENGVSRGSGEAIGGTSSGGFFDYTTVRADLLANELPGDTNFNALPTGSAIQGQSQIVVWRAQEKVLGLLPGNNAAVDGYVTFDSLTNPANLTGVALHEITHAMGRIASGPEPDIFDFFRFTSVGTISLDNSTPPAQQAFFSVNGGTTDLADYGNLSDTSDFLNATAIGGDRASTLTANDPFNQYYDSNTVQTLTAVDRTQLDALGFSTQAACFAAGTMIATQDGEIAVEALRPGDFVRTAGGPCRPVQWVGFRDIDLTRHHAREDADPIRIHASALADGIPARDLRVSPEHALYLNGGLVPARLLVNGASIAWEINVQQVTWYHVELETHDLLLAEGAATESYLDTGNRSAFQNADGSAMSHAGIADRQQKRLDRSCAPFLDDPSTVEPIWRRLAERSETIGLALPPTPAVTRDPGLCVGIGAKRYQPLMIKDGRYVFALPAASGQAHLLSRAAAPTWHRPWLVDYRALGVAVGGIEIQGAADLDVIPPDHPDLTDGWWAAEHDAAGVWRWTDGDATLPMVLDKPVVLEILVREAAIYPAGASAA